jgi:histidinol-phosphatase (PHP family)
MADFAFAHGFTELGFSGHCPLPFENTYSITDYEGYCNEVRRLKEEYAGRMEIHLGLEIDYVPGMLEDYTPLIEQGQLEYTIGSVHLIPDPASPPAPLQGERGVGCSVSTPLSQGRGAGGEAWMIDGSRYQTYDEGLMRIFGGDIRRGVRAYFHNENAMLERNRPTILGHPDKIVMHNRDRYFHEDEPWYRDLALETIHLAKELDTIVEINTRGIYKGRHADYYPGKWLINEMKALRIPVIVSTDAHAPEDLLRTEGAYEYLKEIGYRDVLISLHGVL